MTDKRATSCATKFAAKLLLVVIIGAVLNLLVAWCLAVSVDPFKVQQRGGMGFKSGLHWTISTRGRFGTLIVTSVWRKNANPGVTELRPDQFAPSWAHLEKPTNLSDLIVSGNEQRDIEARGWPLLSFWGELSFRSQLELADVAHRELSGCIRVPFSPWTIVRLSSGKAITQPRVLPYWPIWSGLLLNSLIYGSVVWFVCFGWREIRRWHRRRHQRCEACGYPIGVSAVCTECGRPVAA